jgi:hypothetical protein
MCGGRVALTGGRWLLPAKLACAVQPAFRIVVSLFCGVSSIFVGRKLVMKAWSVIGLLFGAAMFATIPITPQVTPRGLELSVDHAQAITYGRYRRVHRRAYRRGYYGAPYYGYYSAPYYPLRYGRY